MAALFRMISTTTEPTMPTGAKPEATVSLMQSPRSYHLPAYPDAREWDERERRACGGAAAGQRIAHWDKKREKCLNCKHIYLKTLSRHAGFCSVDCKSNAAYIDKVNRTIKAVRSAVDQQRQQEEEAEKNSKAEEPTGSEESTDDATDAPAAQAHTFAEFGLEARLPTDQHVEWAFSAMY